MKNDFDEFNDRSRSEQRAKRRKTNIILNSLIIAVLILIIIVAVSIFSSGDKEQVKTDDKTVEKSEKMSKAQEKPNEKAENKQPKNKDNEKVDEEELNNNGETSETDAETEDSEPVITEGGSSPNVKNTVINPAWKPVGTDQTGEHTTVFNKDSTDWSEMENAISYATGLSHDNMTIWFLGNGGENKAIGTVTSKDNQQVYRVYIEWVDGQGWKPTKVEELYENDKGR